MTGSDSTNAKNPRPAMRQNLPVILDLVIERREYEPPKHKFLKSVLSDEKEVIVFRVQIAGQMSNTTGMSPMLYVGDVMLKEFEQVEKGVYDFFAFSRDIEAIEEGAPITFGWMGKTPDSRKSEFRFKRP